MFLTNWTFISGPLPLLVRKFLKTAVLFFVVSPSDLLFPVGRKITWLIMVPFPFILRVILIMNFGVGVILVLDWPLTVSRALPVNYFR